MKKYTVEEVIEMLRDEVRKTHSLRRAARKMGISPGILSETINTIRPPGPTVCKFLGLRCVTHNRTYYERIG